MENTKDIYDSLSYLLCSIPILLAWIGAVYYATKHYSILSKFIYIVMGGMALWLGVIMVLGAVTGRPLPEVIRFIILPSLAFIVTFYLVGKYLPNRATKQKRKKTE